METRYYAAAGGLVVRDGQLLILHKHLKNEYVLPKGHIEAGETAEACALREVREETGYAHLEVLADLGTLRGEFDLDGIHYQRDETYFLMRLVDDERWVGGGYDAAAYDQETFHQLWAPVTEAVTRLTFEPARSFGRRAAEWVARHGLAALS